MPAAPLTKKLGKALRIVREAKVHMADRHQWRNSDRARIERTIEQTQDALDELAELMKT